MAAGEKDVTMADGEDSVEVSGSGRLGIAALVFLTLGLFGCAALSGGAVEQASTDPARKHAAHYAFVDVQHWLSGPDGMRQNRVDPQPLSPEAHARVLDRIQALPLEQNYILAGCQDRAHAAWLALDPEDQDRVFKVWIMSGSLLTVAFDGSIYPWGRKDIGWDFHVALAWLDESGTTRVFDPAVHGIEPVSQDAWLDGFHIPPASVVFRLHGHWYAYHQVQRGHGAGFDKGRAPFNGSFYAYEGVVEEEEWLPRNLARDTVAAELAGTSCAPLAGLLRRPNDLSEALDDLASRGCNVDSDCAGYCVTWVEQVAFWRSIVNDAIARRPAHQVAPAPARELQVPGLSHFLDHGLP